MPVRMRVARRLTGCEQADGKMRWRRAGKVRVKGVSTRCGYPCVPRQPVVGRPTTVTGRTSQLTARGTPVIAATSAPRLGLSLPHLHRDCARPCHICAGTRLTPATSAPGLRSPLPHLHRDCAHSCHPCCWDCARLCHPCCRDCASDCPRRTKPEGLRALVPPAESSMQMNAPKQYRTIVMYTAG
jgi:hypothetical protein